MRRNKKTTTGRRAANLLALLLCICLALSGLAAVSRAFAGACLPASADGTEGSEHSLGSEDLSLLMPSSYEQFLPMDSVSGISVSDGYIAVADGSSIYVYDGTEYRTFEHSVSVGQLEFDENHVLYFVDSNEDLFTLDCTQESPEETATGETCGAFALSDEGLYFSRSTQNGTNIYLGSTSNTIDDKLSSGIVPAMTYADGVLYYMDGYTLCTYDYSAGYGATLFKLDTYAYNIAVLGTTLYVTDSGKTCFYTMDISSNGTETTYYGDSDSCAYSAICLDGEDLYVTSVVESDHTKIQRFDTAECAFTDYEISSSSLSDNRLYSADRSIVTDEYLIIGDAGMTGGTGRLLLYNLETGEYLSFSVDVIPSVIASNGESILVSNGGELYAYDFEGTPLSGMINGYSGNIVGIGCAEDGDYLFINANNLCYAVDAESFTISGGSDWAKTMSTTAVSLAADIYGNIYVEYGSGAVQKYTPSEFQSTSSGTAVCSFSPAVSNISVDFDGNVYGLNGNTLYCSDGNSYDVDSEGALYGADATLVDFAFGYEHGTVYFAYENYVLSTESVDVPNLNNLDTGDAYQIIFEQTGNVGSGLVSVITFNENAVFIHFTLDELTEDAEVFPYEGYSRISDVNALVLGELEIHGLDYYIVSIYDSSSHSYTAGLALQEVCTLMDESLYTSTPDNFDDGAGYITNDVSLYKYPYLTSALAVTSLPKNTVVTVITEISLSDSIDYDYYYVSWTDDDGDTLYGYVPKSFVRDFSALTEQNEAVYYKTLTPDEDITLKSSAGTSYTLSAGTEYTVLVYYSDDGSAMIALTVDNIRYYAVVDASLFETDTYSALRYFIAVLLILADIAIIVNYSAYRAYQRENERRQ